MTRKKTTNRKPLIALLVLLVVITGAFIGTLAKYVTSNNVSDGAVAAKFGLNIPGTIDLFSDSYNSVEADTEGKKIIAPGASGQNVFVVTGTSEVAYRVSAEVSVVYSEEWDGYAPLKFSLDGDIWTNLDDFQQELSAELESDIMAPNAEYTSTQTIHWKWPFDVSPADDVKDTAMGVMAAEGTFPKVTVDIKVTATQVD